MAYRGVACDNANQSEMSLGWDNKIKQQRQQRTDSSKYRTSPLSDSLTDYTGYTLAVRLISLLTG